LIAAILLLAGLVLAGLAMRVDTRLKKVLLGMAWVLAWIWALVAGVGGLALLIHQGPLPITNGWFAMFSGGAACPLTGLLLKKYAGVTISIRTQLAIALLIFIAGRIAVVVLLHRPFIPRCEARCW
jgi:hypothetical protein